MAFWSAHTHSKYSARDALPSVNELVAKAQQLNYQALGLTDHGTMAGVAQLYTFCRKAGINPLPGVEAYVAPTRHTAKRPDSMHMGMLAISDKGYRNLVGLVTASHRNYRYMPIIDFADLAAASKDGRLEGIVAMSGCHFGVLPKLLRGGSPDGAANVMKAFAGWFKDGFYLEIQNHAVVKPDQHDDLQARLLFDISKNLGLPVLINQDTHYIERNQQPTHDTMKRLVSWSDDPDDALFPGDGYHMADDLWMQLHHEPDIYAAGMEGLADLASKAKVVIPELDTFQLKVPDTTLTGDPDQELMVRASNALSVAIESGKVKKAREKDYWARFEEEFEVVANAGFSGYLLFTATVCDWMTEKDITYSVRGSASGSLLCWLLDITSFDPIAWGLRFDRFLSSDRTKPPDIDIDVEHERRDQVLEWLMESYHVVNIGTWLAMGMSEDEFGDAKGSLMVRHKMAARKTGEDPDAPVSPETLRRLKAVADHGPYMGYGVHAAGLLITPDAETAAVVPLNYVASSKTMVTAFDKDDVEKFGLVKLDVLGLKTLSALRTMQELTGVRIDSIPFNDKKVYQALGRGDTVGLFQLEGGSSRTGVRKLKPTKISDVIAAMALFRPATMDSGATEEYISRRNGYSKVPVRHPVIADETKDTYGVLLYQEQAIGVLRGVGLQADEIEKARKAIKASNADVGGAREEMQRILTRVRELGKDLGLGIDDLAWLERALDAYAGYGFNKAHATAYGVLAYITGWYAVNHPVAFWAGMLKAYTGAKQEPTYLKAARDAGVQIRKPHVNRSGVGYTADIQNKAIRKGLTAIKGIGEKAAEELARHAPYASLDDLARKVSAKRVTGAKALGAGHTPQACGGVITHLFEAGALDGLGREGQ